MKLANQVALVTGGSRGIGRAVALGLAREGADVCIAARSREALEAVADEIRALGRDVLAAPCDVTDAAQVDDLVAQTLARFGRIDLLVNNAGGNHQRAALAESDLASWCGTMQLNLHSTFYCCRAVVPHMVAAGRGKIINVGSGAGYAARPGNNAYDVSKAAVRHLTRCLALEVWQHGIEVNELIPGPVYTDLTKEVFAPPGHSTPPPIAPSERVKSPEECVDLVVFLATQPPGGPTGQSFSLARRPL